MPLLALQTAKRFDNLGYRLLQYRQYYIKTKLDVYKALAESSLDEKLLAAGENDHSYMANIACR